MTYLWIALGGALGSVTRYWLAEMIIRRTEGPLPWGTIVVNITGSFIIGALAAMGEVEGRWLSTPTAKQFLMIGVCGGYTTFSSFSLQTLNLAREGQWFAVGANIALSVVLCLLAVWLGYLLGLWLNGPRGQ